MRIAVGFSVLVAVALGAVIAVKDAEIGELARLNEVITGELATASSELKRTQKELQSQTRQLRTAREQLDVANRSIDRLDQRVNSATEQAATTNPDDEEAITEDPKVAASRSFMKAIGKFMDNPELRGMREARQRESFKKSYSALFEILGLDAELDEEVRAVLLARQLAMAEFGPKFMALAGNRNGLQALTEEMSGIRDDYDKSLEDLLGDDYSQLLEYETTVHDRESLGRLSQRLDAAGEPLDDVTNEAMLQVMSEARRSAELDADWQDPRVLGELMEPGAVDALLGQVDEMQSTVFERSEEILTESQRELLGRQQKMQSGMLKATMRAFAQ
ncbi:MAG: chromosome segregation ATPase [Rhodothermales bacterium]|jgi:chromosome segregation ATPase